MHVYDTTVDHPLVANTAWLPSRPAEQVNDHIWLSRSNSYPYLICSPDGDVVINTGTAAQGVPARRECSSGPGSPGTRTGRAGAPTRGARRARPRRRRRPRSPHP